MQDAALTTSPTDDAPLLRAQAIPDYFPALDGLRFFCAAGVVVAHSFGEAAINADVHHPLHAFVGNIGRTGVDVFFALSGFLITKLLLDEKSRAGRVRISAFYMRRTLRIWPVYYIALLVGFGGAALFGLPFQRLFGFHSHPALFRSQLVMHLAFLGNWTTRDLPTPIATLWSVCIEEQFYLLFPITFVFSSRKYPALVPAAVGIALSCIVRVIMAMTGGPIFHNTFAHADNLLTGALLAQLLHARPGALVGFFRRLGGAAEVIAVAGLLVFNQWDISTITSPGEWLCFYLVSALTTTFVVGTFGLGSGAVGRWLARPKLRFLGQLTYAAYAFHLYAVTVVWVVLNRVIPASIGPWAMCTLRAAIAIPAAMLLAWLCRITFELRILRLKSKFQPLSNASTGRLAPRQKREETVSQAR